MYVSRMDACLNRWFTIYEGGAGLLESEGGYLLLQRSIPRNGGRGELGLDPKIRIVSTESDGTGCNRSTLKLGNVFKEKRSWRFNCW